MGKVGVNKMKEVFLKNFYSIMSQKHMSLDEQMEYLKQELDNTFGFDDDSNEKHE